MLCKSFLTPELLKMKVRSKRRLKPTHGRVVLSYPRRHDSSKTLMSNCQITQTHSFLLVVGAVLTARGGAWYSLRYHLKGKCDLHNKAEYMLELFRLRKLYRYISFFHPTSHSVFTEGTSPADKRLGREADRSTASSADDKNEWSCTSTSPGSVMFSTGTTLPVNLFHY